MEKVVGQCEHCGTDYEVMAVVDGDQIITCPNCKKESENWDTPENSQMAPSIVEVSR